MNFKELLKKNGFTMHKLAKDAKVGQATVNEIANGKRKFIRLETASKLATTLGVAVDEINSCIRGD